MLSGQLLQQGGGCTRWRRCILLQTWWIVCAAISNSLCPFRDLFKCEGNFLTRLFFFAAANFRVEIGGLHLQRLWAVSSLHLTPV
jgi:hypothetical protein